MSAERHRMAAGRTPLGWGVLLAVAKNWGVTMRVAVLMIIVIGGIVAVASCLGPVGVASLVALAGGEGARRALAGRPRR